MPRGIMQIRITMTHGIVKPIPEATRTNTRQRIIAGAAELIRRKGLNVTSLRNVVDYVGASRGSIVHHFPRGKQQLLFEAIELAGREVSVPLKKLVDTLGTIKGLNAFIQLWRIELEGSNFEAGCPVLVAAVEPYTNDRLVSNSIGETESLREKTASIFVEWGQIISNALIKDGVKDKRAQRIGNMVTASIEGSVAMCRATNSSKPLTDIQEELELIITFAIKNHKT